MVDRTKLRESRLVHDYDILCQANVYCIEDTVIPQQQEMQGLENGEPLYPKPSTMICLDSSFLFAKSFKTKENLIPLS